MSATEAREDAHGPTGLDGSHAPTRRVIPSLDALAADPTRVHALPRDSVLAVAAQAMALHGACLLALARADEPRGVEAVLTLTDAANRLQISPTTLYRKARNELRCLLVNLGTTSLRFSASRIDAYIRGSLNDLGPTNEFSGIVRRRKPSRDSHG